MLVGLALAQIGGPANRAALVKEFDDGKALRKPWCALALGLLVHGERERQARANQSVERDELVASVLQQALRDAREPGLVGALGIALGLCGATDAAPLMRQRLLDGLAKEQMAGYLCIGLALMQDQGAVEDIRRIMATAGRRPDLLVQAAVALGRLGDRQATDVMLERMTGSQANLTQLAAFATAMSQVGDRRSIDALIRLLHDASAGALPRAFAAAALGGDLRLAPPALEHADRRRHQVPRDGRDADEPGHRHPRHPLALRENAQRRRRLHRIRARWQRRSTGSREASHSCR